MCFSDFPIPASFPPFMGHDKIIEYFNMYVDHFNFRDRIHFNTRVENLKRASDSDSTGRYEVT